MHTAIARMLAAPTAFAKQGGGHREKSADSIYAYQRGGRVAPDGNNKKVEPMRADGKVEGPKGTDRVPMWAEDGEYVLPKKTVQAMGGSTAIDRLVAATNGKTPGGKPVKRDNSVFSGAVARMMAPTTAPAAGGGGRRKPPTAQDRPVSGFEDGGETGGDSYSSSHERRQWLIDIAQRGNKMPAAQITLAASRPASPPKDAKARLVAGYEAGDPVAQITAASTRQATDKAPKTAKDRMVAGYALGGSVSSFEGDAQAIADRIARQSRLGGGGGSGGASMPPVELSPINYDVPPAKRMSVQEIPGASPKPAPTPTAAGNTAAAAGDAAAAESGSLAGTAARGRAFSIGQKVGAAARMLAPVARGAAVAAPLYGFGDYHVNDPSIDSSAAGTFKYLANGEFSKAGQSLKKGAVEAGLDSVSGITKAVDAVGRMVGADPGLNQAFDAKVRSDMGGMLEPAPGVAQTKLSDLVSAGGSVPTSGATPVSPRGVQTPTSRSPNVAISASPAFQRLTDQKGRTIYTNDPSGTADWIKGGMKPGVGTLPTDQTALDRLIRASEIRQSTIDSLAGGRSGPAVASIANSDATDASTQRWQDAIDSIKGEGRTAKSLRAGLMRAAASDALGRDELASRDAQAAQRDATDRRGQDLAYDRATAGLALDAEGKRLANEQTRRISVLQDRIINPRSAEDAAAAEKQLQALQRKSSQASDEATKARYGLISALAKAYNDNPPLTKDASGNDVPMSFEQFAAPALAMASGRAAPSGQPDRTATMAEVEATAKARGMSPEQVRSLLQAQGIEVR